MVFILPRKVYGESFLLEELLDILESSVARARTRPTWKFSSECAVNLAGSLRMTFTMRKLVKHGFKRTAAARVKSEMHLYTTPTNESYRLRLTTRSVRFVTRSVRYFYNSHLVRYQ